MKSPFKDNFDDGRKNLEQKALSSKEQRTEQMIEKKLLKTYISYSQYYLDAFKIILVGIYFLVRPQGFFPEFLSIDIILTILLVIGFIVLFCGFIFGAYCVFSIMLNGISYWIHSKNIFGIFKYLSHLPLVGEKQKPIISSKRLLLFLMYTEIVISSFFIIDYLFEL